MTGFFILSGRVDVPFTYRVRKVRDGGVYCLRSVEVFQQIPAQEEPAPTRPGRRTTTTTEEQTGVRGGEGRKQAAAATTTPCFTATVSFKRRENPASYVDFRYQTPHLGAKHLRKTYAGVLGDGKQPEDQPIAPGADATWWTRRPHAAGGGGDEAGEKFPGLDIRKVDMGAYNHGPGSVDQAGRWRQLCFYRLIKDEDEDDGDETSTLNLSACAHLYASDRNSLFLIPRALGFEEQIVPVSSLSHTVIFHGEAAELRACDGQTGPSWFLQEAWTDNGGSNRGCHESRLWRWKGGGEGEDVIIATTRQDGMVRVPVPVPVPARSGSGWEDQKRKGTGHKVGKPKL